ncbi:MAG: DNA methyltransferase [Chloroflexi bacterium]|nr:DNA methyltransferase [Chloroflexota bacterium]
MAERNFKNRPLYHGDNLKFLRGIHSETVDLIATDPPFNKNRDFHATPDSLAAGAKFQDRWSWERDVHQDWVDQITDDYPRLMEAIESARFAHSDGMGAFMCFMAVRLLEMWRVLKPTGSLYLHCDPTASHYLKAVLDAIFGWRNFRNEIVWCYNVGGKSKRWWARKHDCILFYSKTKTYWFDGKAAGIPRDTGSKSFGGRIGVDEDGRPYQDKIVRKSGKIYRYYLDEPKIPEDWWTDINSLQSGVHERTGYPTQKPLALYERIIKASSNDSDIVLDPFCGCATTPVAAERLGRQWVGIDIWDKAHGVVVDRLEKEVGLFGEVHYSTEPPTRTDDAQPAAPFLRVKQVHEPPGPKMSRADMYAHLLEQHGSRCQGCYRDFDDPRYLQLDHNVPRSDGGLNHISNRVLLCGPCNRLKSNIYTLSGLRRQNKQLGYMSKELI